VFPGSNWERIESELFEAQLLEGPPPRGSNWERIEREREAPLDALNKVALQQLGKN
jgi:hypothetical protein